MSDVKTLQDLFIDELRRIYGAEQQLARALPILAKAATAPELRQAFQSHFEETEMHVERLQQVFGLFGEKPTAATSDPIRAIVDEGRELIGGPADDAVRDAGLIAAAQEAEHFEIAAYGTLRTWAAALERQEAVHTLEWTLEEEKQADHRLTEIARSLNLQAATAHAH